jgi:hypothetical protein
VEYFSHDSLEYIVNTQSDFPPLDICFVSNSFMSVTAAILLDRRVISFESTTKESLTANTEFTYLYVFIEIEKIITLRKRDRREKDCSRMRE